MDAPAALRRWTDEIRRTTALDDVANRLEGLVDRTLGNRALRSLLDGTWLGHPLHPALTDLPIGFWTSAMVLDFVGDASSARSAKRLVGLGVISAIPTVMSGAVDWRSTEGSSRRVGVAHAALNSSAIVLYTCSWVVRGRTRSPLGIALGVVAATAATAAGHLGGELAFSSPERNEFGDQSTSEPEPDYLAPDYLAPDYEAPDYQA